MTLLALNSPKTPLPQTVDLKEMEQWGQVPKESLKKPREKPAENPVPL